MELRDYAAEARGVLGRAPAWLARHPEVAAQIGAAVTEGFAGSTVILGWLRADYGPGTAKGGDDPWLPAWKKASVDYLMRSWRGG